MIVEKPDKVKRNIAFSVLNQDTAAEEKEIDNLVYELNDLTEEEIKYIEG
mgnify:CR=1 FL=1